MNLITLKAISENRNIIFLTILLTFVLLSSEPLMRSLGDYLDNRASASEAETLRQFQDGDANIQITPMPILADDK